MFWIERSDIEILRTNGDVRGLIEILSESESPCVRIFAANALGQIGDPVAVPALLDCVSDMRGCNHKHVERVAKEALALIDASAVEPLAAALRSDRREIRDSAVEVIGKIGDTRAVEPLISALGYSERPAIALGRIADPTAVEPLIASLRSSDTRLQSSAAIALGQIGDERAVEPLSALLKHEDSYVRGKAEQALRDMHDPEVKRRRDGCALLRKIAAEILDIDQKIINFPKNPVRYFQPDRDFIIIHDIWAIFEPSTEV